MMPSQTFNTEIWKSETSNAMGIVVPPMVIEALRAGKRPKVIVTVNGYSYRSTVAVMGGRFFLPFAREHRLEAGLEHGGAIDVTLTLDTAPREVDVPADLEAALKAAGAYDAFKALSFTHRKEHVRAVEEAKAAETRARRIAKAVELAMRSRE